MVFLSTIFSFALPTQVLASTTCQPIYGGGQTCVTTGDVTINKAVLNPQTDQYVDNLSINDPRYQPGYTATFKITVTNTGSSKISKVKITDIFPQYVDFVSGPGSFDSNTKVLAFETDNLATNESRSFTVTGKVVDDSRIPTNEGDVVCVVNQAIATNLDNSAQTSQDNSQLCIEKVATVSGFPVFATAGISTSPATGPEAIGLISLIPTGIAGWFLRKHSVKKNILN